MKKILLALLCAIFAFALQAQQISVANEMATVNSNTQITVTALVGNTTSQPAHFWVRLYSQQGTLLLRDSVNMQALPAFVAQQTMTFAVAGLSPSTVYDLTVYGTNAIATGATPVMSAKTFGPPRWLRHFSPKLGTVTTETRSRVDCGGQCQVRVHYGTSKASLSSLTALQVVTGYEDTVSVFVPTMPGQKIYYRTFVGNQYGFVQGAIDSFVALPATTSTATFLNVQPSKVSATFSVAVYPGTSQNTRARVIVYDAQMSSNIPVDTIFTSYTNKADTFSLTATGLKPNYWYEAELEVQNMGSSSWVPSSDVDFQTLPVAPTVVSPIITGTTINTANAQIIYSIDPVNTVQLEESLFGLDGAPNIFINRYVGAFTGNGTNTRPAFTGLLPNTTYQYVVKATGVDGITTSSINFLTPDELAPPVLSAVLASTGRNEIECLVTLSGYTGVANLQAEVFWGNQLVTQKTWPNQPVGLNPSTYTYTVDDLDPGQAFLIRWTAWRGNSSKTAMDTVIAGTQLGGIPNVALTFYAQQGTTCQLDLASSTGGYLSSGLVVRGYYPGSSYVEMFFQQERRDTFFYADFYNLQPNTTYFFEAVQQNAQFGQIVSNTVTCQTGQITSVVEAVEEEVVEITVEDFLLRVKNAPENLPIAIFDITGRSLLKTNSDNQNIDLRELLFSGDIIIVHLYLSDGEVKVKKIQAPQ